MNESEQPTMRGRPVSLLVVVLLWVVGIPVLVSACVALYSMATQPPDNAGQMVLVVAVALAYLVVWPSILYQAVATRRRGQPLR